MGQVSQARNTVLFINSVIDVLTILTGIFVLARKYVLAGNQTMSDNCLRAEKRTETIEVARYFRYSLYHFT